MLTVINYRVSRFFGNTLYLVALGYYTVISFLGYNGKFNPPYSIGFYTGIKIITCLALPFLHHTELLLSPTFVYAIVWFASLFTFNIPMHIGPLLVIGAR